MMVLVSIPWAKRVWALSFFTVLALAGLAEALEEIPLMPRPHALNALSSSPGLSVRRQYPSMLLKFLQQTVVDVQPLCSDGGEQFHFVKPWLGRPELAHRFSPLISSSVPGRETSS
jgi:hypothetical protein